jgi:3',5'-cyclic AMP phosphodiesterase CpdA
MISDIHDNTKTFARFVELVHQSRPEMVLFTGDLTLSGQTDQFDLMFDRLPELETPFYATLGNHELMGSAADRFEKRIGPADVSFNVRGVQVMLLDSANALIAPESYGWIAQQLSQRPDGPALVLTHIPPLDPAGTRDHAFSVREDAEHLLQVLSDGAVTHLFVGHIHTWATYSMRGIPVTLAGGGGGQMEGVEGIGHHYADVVVDPLAPQVVTVKRVDLD